MMTWEASYRHCQRLARSAASNFYYSFWLLPADQRRAMCALYAFFRHTDDLSDSDAPADVRRGHLSAWRQSLVAALAGDLRDPLLPALVDTVARYRIPHAYLFDALDGAEMDLHSPAYETFDELEGYCYRVASVVGLACIHVWGFEGAPALDRATACGVAFQLTNILRDLREDARRGRMYLPREELRRFGYRLEELHREAPEEPFFELMRFQVERAEHFYREAAGLDAHLSPAGRRVFRLMFATYHALLQEIARRPGDVLTRRLGLSVWRKMRLLASMGLGGAPEAVVRLRNAPNEREYLPS